MFIKTVRHCHRWCGEIVEKVLDVEITMELAEIEKHKKSFQVDAGWTALGSQFSIGFVSGELCAHSRIPHMCLKQETQDTGQEWIVHGTILTPTDIIIEEWEGTGELRSDPYVWGCHDEFVSWHKEVNVDHILNCELFSLLSKAANLKGDWSKDDLSFPNDILTTIAKELTASDDGNVEFQAKSLCGETKSLYAHRAILSARLFNSDFSEGSDPPLGSPNQCPRRVIRSHEQFELLHATLYYLYTDKVLFGADEKVAETLGMPACDAEHLFAVAHRLDIPKLREKALSFLIETRNLDNVLPRVFGEFGLKYDEVRQAYTKVFHNFWTQVKDSKEFEVYFEAMEEEDEGRGVSVNRRFRELMRRLSIPFPAAAQM